MRLCLGIRGKNPKSLPAQLVPSVKSGSREDGFHVQNSGLHQQRVLARGALALACCLDSIGSVVVYLLTKIQAPEEIGNFRVVI